MREEAAETNHQLSFREVLEHYGINYDGDYAVFLIRVAVLVEEFPKLLQANISIHFLKMNMVQIESVCRNAGNFWKVDDNLAAINLGN